MMNAITCFFELWLIVLAWWWILTFLSLYNSFVTLVSPFFLANPVLSLSQGSVIKVKRARGDNPDILPEPEPTNPTSDFENSYNYVCESCCFHAWLKLHLLKLHQHACVVFSLSVSRLASLDQSIHKLNVGQYTLDVKVSQLIERLTRIDGTLLFVWLTLVLLYPFLWVPVLVQVYSSSNPQYVHI